MSRIAIICEDYGNISSALFLITHNYYDSPVTLIVPGHQDLYKFFQVINERVLHNTISLIYVEQYRPERIKARGINKLFHIIPDIIGERRHLKINFNKYFAGMEGYEIHFFSRGYNAFTFYLLKKLGERNRWVYMLNTSSDIPYSMMSQYTPKNIGSLVRLVILKLIYGFDIALGQFPSEAPYVNGFAFIPDKVMRENVDKEVSLAERTEMMKGFDLSRFRVFDTGYYHIIYFDDGLIESFLFADWDTYRRQLGEIFEVIKKYFPENEVASKFHPAFPANKERLKIGKLLPDYIPAEFLYNDNTKMYLSLFSSSIANVEKGLAVSIADMVTFNDEKMKTKLKEYIKGQSKSKILFPKTLKEFEKILSDLKS